ncbi:hypothetical protein D3C87_310690 [compost metagenome]
MSIYLTVNTIAELTCLLIGCFCLYNDKEPVWRFFILYLLLICLTEIFAIHMRKVLGISNLPLYNIFLIVECFSISIFFYNLLKKYRDRSKWLMIWLFLFVIIYGSELFSNQFSNFVFITAAAISLVFVLASLYYYYLLLRDEKYEKLDSYAPFWWVNGTLIFYFGSTALNIFFDYLIRDQLSQFQHSIRYIIFNVLNIILYCCWSYAFICRYHQRKSSS